MFHVSDENPAHRMPVCLRDLRIPKRSDAGQEESFQSRHAKECACTFWARGFRLKASDLGDFSRTPTGKLPSSHKIGQT